MLIRPARGDDVASLSEIARAAFIRYTPRIGRPAAPVDADYGDLVARGTTWVAVDDDAVVGYIVLLDRSDHLWVDNVAVAPGAQGRGVGAQLLRLAEEQAGSRGHREIRLCTNEAMTENLDYYPRRGYTETHRDSHNGYRRVYFSKSLSPPDPGCASGQSELF